MRVPITLAVFILASLAQIALAQNSALVGVVVARGSGERLAFSIVALPELQREQFASDSGVFYFGGLPSGGTALRIRRLGYAPLDTFVTVGTSTDTVRIMLSRVAVQLGSITVSAYPPCHNPGIPTGQRDSALTVILNQVRMNAEQYKFLVKQYPFYYVTEVVRSSRSKKDGETQIDSHQLRRQEAQSDSKYRPGRVVSRRGGLSFFQLPGLIDFADPDFLSAHCFHLRGTEVVENEVVIRIDLVAAARIKDPDVDGSIYVDPGSFQVTRTRLRLSKISRDIKYLLDLEVTTEFREIMPSIPIIGRMSSVQTINPQASMPIDMAWETFQLAGFEFLRGKPGDDVKKSP